MITAQGLSDVMFHSRQYFRPVLSPSTVSGVARKELLIASADKNKPLPIAIIWWIITTTKNK